MPLLRAMFRYSTHFSLLLFSLRVISLLIALSLTYLNSVLLLTWPLFNPLASTIVLNILLDARGALFATTVLFISSIVILFSSFYMAHDIFLKRFTILVILFVLSIILLIFIPNIIALLLGWDGLGITSFILVVYYQNPKSLAGGIFTALSNRIGDAIILITIAFILNQGDWLIINLSHSPHHQILTILILLAAITKSAQLPFSSWLPAAIAAPTPVSALVHSSTLVTAGVFLLIRFFPFLVISSLFSSLLLFISTCTLTMAGIVAITECDTKKIIALSTLRQLGVIILSLSLGLVDLALFHLLTHAIFKALLFITAGTLLHLFSHTQDLRNFGNLSLHLPFTTAAIVISNLALSGFPFIAGFYSKDLILEHILEASPSFLLLIIALGATILTSAYATRLIISVVWTPALHAPCHMAQEESPLIFIPLLSLSVFAVIGGALFNWIYIPSTSIPLLSSNIKIIPLFLTLWGAYLTWTFSLFLTSIKSFSLSHPLLISSLTSIWFFTPLSTQPPLYSAFLLAQQHSTYLDQGWLETFGPKVVPTLSTSTLNLLQPWTITSPVPLFFLSFIICSPLVLHLIF